MYVRGEKTFLNMVQKTVFSYPHWPSSIRPTFLKANFTTEGKGDFRASVAREKKSKKRRRGVWTQRVNTFAASIRRRRRPFPTEEEDGRTRVSATPPGERERAHCRLEHTPIVAPSHSVSLKRAQDATLPKWGPTQRREGGEGKGGPLSRTLHLPLPSFPICHYVKWGRVKSCWVDFFRGK